MKTNYKGTLEVKWMYEWQKINNVPNQKVWYYCWFILAQAWSIFEAFFWNSAYVWECQFCKILSQKYVRLYNFFVKMWMSVGTQYSVLYILRIFHADCRGTICIDDTVYVHSQKGFFRFQVTSLHFIPVIKFEVILILNERAC